MLGKKIYLAVLVACLLGNEAQGNPFKIFKRHFIPGISEDISPRQGRNSKLMNFGAPLETDAALPLSLTLLEDAVEDAVEEEVEQLPLEAEEEVVPVAEPEVVEDMEEDLSAEETMIDNLADPSLIDLEDAVTEVMINDIISSLTADQEDRGGKEHEDKIGLTSGQTNFNVVEKERSAAPPQVEKTRSAAQVNSLPQQSQVYQFKQPAPTGYNNNYGPYPPQVGRSPQQPLAQQPLPQQPIGQQPLGQQPLGQQQFYPEQYQQQQQQQQQYAYPPQQQFQQIQYPSRGYGNAQPRSTGLANDFGINMGDDLIGDPENNNYPSQPQLDQRDIENRQFEDSTAPGTDAPEEEEENVTDAAPVEEPATDAPAAEGGDAKEEEDDVRCINKVMQVEETVYEERIKCQHTFTEKCHDTFITDYVPTQEKKCETSFKKNCHITYKPMMFEEQVKVCNEPLKKVCSDDTVGEEVCKTHYETICETRYKEHEVEQDEPVCEMVVERRCNGVAVPLPDEGSEVARLFGRQRRQAPELVEGDLGGNDLSSDLGFLQSEGDLASVGEECEDWPVQKCRLEKRVVKKSNPETSCQKMPREICAPSNCAFEKSDKVCREEARNLVQNIPSEQCDLEPQENCKMETVLVPRLIQQPNCIKVPKEICVNAKTNPRKVKKPVIKEWCYRPSDLRSPSSRLALTQFFRQ